MINETYRKAFGETPEDLAKLGGGDKPNAKKVCEILRIFRTCVLDAVSYNSSAHVAKFFFGYREIDLAEATKHLESLGYDATLNVNLISISNMYKRGAHYEP